VPVVLVEVRVRVTRRLREKRRNTIWARLYPHEQLGAEPPDSFCGGRRKPLEAIGLSGPVASDR
jgi:hypothetical protein